jgi:hypothetical protein
LSGRSGELVRRREGDLLCCANSFRKDNYILPIE